MYKYDEVELAMAAVVGMVSEISMLIFAHFTVMYMFFHK
jgi:hypothetical protein